MDRDIEEWEIRLAEPFTLNMKIVRDPPPANTQSKTEVRVFLMGEGNSDVREGSIDAKGEFSVTRVMEGQYRIVPLLGDVASMYSYYLASIRMAEREVLGETVELTAASGAHHDPLQSRWRRVRGTVEDWVPPRGSGAARARSPGLQRFIRTRPAMPAATSRSPICGPENTMHTHSTSSRQTRIWPNCRSITPCASRCVRRILRRRAPGDAVTLKRIGRTIPRGTRVPRHAQDGRRAQQNPDSR